MIEKVYRQNSAVIVVQRNIRKFLTVKRLSLLREMAIVQIQRMRKVIAKWKDFVKKRQILRVTFKMRRVNIPDYFIANLKQRAQRARTMIALRKQRLNALQIVIRFVARIKTYFATLRDFVLRNSKQGFYFRKDQVSVLQSIIEQTAIIAEKKGFPESQLQILKAVTRELIQSRSATGPDQQQLR